MERNCFKKQRESRNSSRWWICQTSPSTWSEIYTVILDSGAQISIFNNSDLLPFYTINVDRIISGVDVLEEIRVGPVPESRMTVSLELMRLTIRGKRLCYVILAASLVGHLPMAFCHHDG
jgi:hypothetical protein